MDPLQLIATGRRRRQAIDYNDADEVEYKDDKDKEDDDDEDDKDTSSLPSLALGTVYEDDTAFMAYDYSHLLPLLDDDIPSTSSSSPLSAPAAVGGLPETDRVVQRPASKSAAVTENHGGGKVL